MITINIVCVGNLKEKFSKEEQEEYCKRLSAFCKLNIVELKEQNQLENSDLIIQKEGEESPVPFSGPFRWKFHH